MPIFVLVLAAVLSAGSAPGAGAAEPFQYTVELDVPQAFREVLESNLDLMRWRGNPRMDARQLERVVERTPADARAIMETQGYYSSQVKAGIEQTNGTPRVRLQIAPGEPVRVSDVELEFRGAITHESEDALPRIAALRREWPLGPGEIFRHEDWESAKRATLRELVGRRYPGARITTSSAAVDPEERTATLEVIIDSGPPHRFGELLIEGLQRYPASIVRNLNPIRPGEEYSQKALFDLQTRLRGTGYFDDVAVEADTAGAPSDAVPVKVTVVEAKSRRVGFGIGVSTDTGVRGQIDYQDNDFFGGGKRLTGRLRADTKEQEATADLLLPLDEKGRRDSFTTGYKLTDIEGEKTETYTAGAKRSWSAGRAEHTIGLQFQNERQQVKGVRTDNVQALVPDYTWAWRNVDSPIMPRRGHVLGLQVGGASRAVLSTQDFVRLHARWQSFWPIGERLSAILRTEAGTVLADSRRGIPSDYLFRTGGSQSVRGYEYLSIGVPEGAATVGGRVLGVASGELVYWMTPAWGAAVFYDVGDAADSWDDFKAKHGYGVGARWRSPVGPVNLDLAYGADRQKLRLHFSLGVAF